MLLYIIGQPTLLAHLQFLVTISKYIVQRLQFLGEVEVTNTRFKNSGSVHFHSCGWSSSQQGLCLLQVIGVKVEVSLSPFLHELSCTSFKSVVGKCFNFSTICTFNNCLSILTTFKYYLLYSQIDQPHLTKPSLYLKTQNWIKAQMNGWSYQNKSFPN